MVNILPLKKRHIGDFGISQIRISAYWDFLEPLNYVFIKKFLKKKYYYVGTLKVPTNNDTLQLIIINILEQILEFDTYYNSDYVLYYERFFSSKLSYVFIKISGKKLIIVSPFHSELTKSI